MRPTSAHCQRRDVPETTAASNSPIAAALRSIAGDGSGVGSVTGIRSGSVPGSGSGSGGGIGLGRGGSGVGVLSLDFIPNSDAGYGSSITLRDVTCLLITSNNFKLID